MEKPSVPDEEFLVYLRFQLNHMFPIETHNIVYDPDLPCPFPEWRRIYWKKIVYALKAFQDQARAQGREILLIDIYRTLENLILFFLIAIQFLFFKK